MFLGFLLTRQLLADERCQTLSLCKSSAISTKYSTRRCNDFGMYIYGVVLVSLLRSSKYTVPVLNNLQLVRVKTLQFTLSVDLLKTRHPAHGYLILPTLPGTVVFAYRCCVAAGVWSGVEGSQSYSVKIRAPVRRGFC